jgi:hypothetical protein
MSEQVLITRLRGAFPLVSMDAGEKAQIHNQVVVANSIKLKKLSLLTA